MEESLEMVELLKKGCHWRNEKPVYLIFHLGFEAS